MTENLNPDAQDCTPCRLMGSIVLLGTSSYLGFEFTRAPPKQRAIFGTLSAVFLALGIYRAATPVRPLTSSKSDV
jgi:hypothetical protein